ncbi:trehalose-phosphatase [Lujinxingia litoralis]|uniref:Trehalose 6-phosphate phosphatase n=1 Tax=Lujinxingia litoralis TaxID=2211119 RepID=A0A328C9L6_9DELT|nr:trehalose-phosphatase [Lujinxingia litoralis]RAL22855.1 trehalose-phosphatase [Lujinxingia litoralis]
MKMLQDVEVEVGGALARGRALVVMLDFDGTLAPITEHYDQARALPGALEAVSALVEAGVEVAIISGRSLHDVRARLPVVGVSYLGSHGLEMAWKGGDVEVVPGAEEARWALQRLEERWGQEFGELEGVVLERKPFGVALHYRMLAEGEEGLVERARELAETGDGLRCKAGKKVLEAVPAIDWHKGRATDLVVRRAESRAPGGVYAMYVGDDVTDEDAFAVLDGESCGVLVAPEDRASAASARVDGPEQVLRLLERLVALGSQQRSAGL